MLPACYAVFPSTQKSDSSGDSSDARTGVVHSQITSPLTPNCGTWEALLQDSFTPVQIRRYLLQRRKSTPSSVPLIQHLRKQMRLTERATVVGITRASYTSEDGGVPKASDTNGGGAVIVDVGPDQHQAIQHAERKARTYGKALLCLACLLCLSVCGNLASSALSILVFKESRFRAAIPSSSLVVPSDSKAAAPVGTGLTSYAGTGLKGVIVTLPFEAPTYVKDTPANPEPPVVATAPDDDTAPLVVSLASVPGVKRCAVAPSGTEACWELADPAMTDIPTEFLYGNTDLTGTLKVGPAVKTIGAFAFEDTKLTGVDLSEATALVEIGAWAFSDTDLGGTLVIPAKVTTIGAAAFYNTKLTGKLKVGPAVKTIGALAFAWTKLTSLELSEATALVEIGQGAFFATDLGGTLVIPAKVTTIGDDAFADTELTGTLKVGPAVKTIGNYAFEGTKVTGLDLSKATSLVEIGHSAFSATELEGTLEAPPRSR
eukprot:scaffold133284_cov65-Phaeocystis_antarctica.AAC.2